MIIERIPLSLDNEYGRGQGVNAYIIQGGSSAVLIDTGADVIGHYEQIVTAWISMGSPKIELILLTHLHSDHSGNVGRLRALWDAPVAIHEAEIQARKSRGEEWRVERTLRGGEILSIGVAVIQVIHSPGHTPGHVCYYLTEERVLFSGDNVLPGTSTLISPPDGNMTAYLSSLRALACLPAEVLAPGHGPTSLGARTIVFSALEHRIRREGEILALIGAGVASSAEIAAALYGQDSVSPRRRLLGAKLIAAYLEHLVETHRLTVRGDRYQRAKTNIASLP